MNVTHQLLETKSKSGYGETKLIAIYMITIVTGKFTNKYETTCFIGLLDSLDAELCIDQVELPKITNEETLTEDAARELIQNYIYEK